jgi:hypothetical protein
MAVTGGRPGISSLFLARFSGVTYNLWHFVQVGDMTTGTYILIRPWYRLAGYGCNCYCISSPVGTTGYKGRRQDNTEKKDAPTGCTQHRRQHALM